MRTSRLSLAALAALATVGTASALAASAPKPGYYLDATGGAVIFKLGKDHKTISQFTANCNQQAGATTGYVIHKHPKLSHGKFSLTTSVKLIAFGSTTTVKLKITGKRSGSKFKGAVTQVSTPAFCAPVSYSAKFFGTHAPMG